jgi:septal ring factor EnvC (AmiA/AmiB activator)
MSGRSLTAAALRLAPLKRRRLVLPWLLTLLAMGAAASAVTAFALRQWMPAATPATLAVAVDGGQAQERHQLQQQLEQARLALGLAQAHGAELERQIDTLTQRARQCQEELVFFRQSGRRGTAQNQNPRE